MERCVAFFFFHFFSSPHTAHDQGVLIEGDPQLAEKAKQVRSKSTTVVRAVVCPQPRNVVFARFNVTGHSGIMTEEEIQAKVSGSKGRMKLLERIETQCIPLEQILTEAGIERNTKIDVMTIDVEGMEAHILQAWDFKAWRVDVVMMEIDKPGAAKKIRNIMKATGLYRGPFRIDLHHPDDIWIRNDMETNDLDSFDVACEERCRKIHLCTKWDDERECE